MRLGVLRNPTSTGNRGRLAPMLPPGTALVETIEASESRAALDRLRKAGAEAVVVDGGDGTVRAAVTALFEVFPGDRPSLAILANGNTNLIGRRLGALGGAPSLARLARMSAADGAALSRSCPVLHLSFADGRPCERGFIAGWAAYAEATRIAAEEMKRRHRAQIFGAILAILRRSLSRAEGPALRRGVSCAFNAEGHNTTLARRFLGIVTTLPGPLLWPLDPFWGTGTGPIRWLDVTAPPRRLALAAPLAALGWPMAWMGDAGYRSGLSGRIELGLPGDIVIDGERIRGGDVLITAHETVSVIRS